MKPSVEAAEVWLAVTVGEHGQAQATAKLSRRAGRLTMEHLVVTGRVDSQALRSISTSRIEAIGNALDGQPVAVPGVVWLGPDSRSVMEQFDGAIYALSSAIWESPTVDPPKPSRARLERPDGSDPDGFSRTVAAAYNDVVATTHRPAVVLAEEAAVPVTTVHRWIREARRRGHLPPAHKGGAG